MNYVQCELKKGNTKTIAWIPQFGTNKIEVKVGRFVQLSGDDDWWEILTVSKPRDGIKVKKDERNYKNFQNSLPDNGKIK